MTYVKATVIDVFVSLRRDTAGSRRFFRRPLSDHGEPAEIATDRASALVCAVDLSLDGTAGGTEARNAARVAPQSGGRVPDGAARRGFQRLVEMPVTGRGESEALLTLATKLLPINQEGAQRRRQLDYVAHFAGASDLRGKWGSRARYRGPAILAVL